MKKLVKIPEDAEIPLVGLIQIGIIDRGTNLLQIRPTSICNLNCPFCSTDSGPFSKFHTTEYIAELDYLVEWVKELIKFKGKIHAFLDSVGETLTYKKIVELVQEISEMDVESIAIETNGTLLTEKLVDELKEAGLHRINLSLHALNEELAKKLAGDKSYDVKKILEIARYIAESGIELLITPVWIPGINDEEIPKIIEFTKSINKNKRWPFLGIQKYEIHKYGRKIERVKALNWWKFFRKIEEWEKEFKVKLRIRPEDFGIKKVKIYPIVFEKGEKARVKILAPGWMKNEMIGVARNRSLTILNCEAEIGDEIKVRILRNKHNLYIAEKI
ncbi:MAG: radical SAM protein [Candidatus Aenigmatarchaeota archaeon]